MLAQQLTAICYKLKRKLSCHLAVQLGFPPIKLLCAAANWDSQHLLPQQYVHAYANSRRTAAQTERGEEEGSDTERHSSFFLNWTQYFDVRNMISFIDMLGLFPMRYEFIFKHLKMHSELPMHCVVFILAYSKKLKIKHYRPTKTCCFHLTACITKYICDRHTGVAWAQREGI